MDDAKLKTIKAKSSARKRHLRDMNDKIRLYMAIADAAISDAARWHAEAKYWQLKYETLLAKSQES